SSSTDGPSLGQYKGREAVKFDKSKDQYLLTKSEDIEILNTSAAEGFSYMAWYYLSEKPSNDRYFIMETSVAFPLSYGLREDDGEYKGQVFTDSGNFYLDEPNGYGANEEQWYNIIVTYDSSTKMHKAYLNGQESGEMTADVTKDLLGLVIGSFRDNNGRFFNGYIDDIAIWNRVLSSEEVNRLQEKQISGEYVYKVFYDGNGNEGGEVPVDSSVYEEDTIVEASSNVNDLTKTGYTLSEWNTKSNGSGVSYQLGDSFVRHNKDITLYAQWEINNYTITFDSAGGSSVDSITQNYNSEITNIPNDPVREGYNFIGWDPVIPDSMPANNMTITAKWEPRDDIEYKIEHYQQNIDDNDYTLKDTESLLGTTEERVFATTKTYEGFDNPSTTPSGIILGDGSLVLEQYYDREEFNVTFKDYNGLNLKTETVRYEGNATAPEEPTREGYIFIGWDESFNNVNKDIITTAQYETGEYKVSFDTNGGSSINNQALDFNSLVIKPDDPVKLGYTFISWYKSELYNEEWDFNNDKVPANDITLHANWKPRDDIEYKIEHYQQNLNNDEYTLIENDILEGTTNEEVTASIKDYQGFNDPVNNASGLILADGSLVLKQYYDRATYNVKFLDKDGKEFQSEIVKYNDKVALSETPTRDNHRFAGWYKDEELSEEFNLSESITKDLVIYPKWTRVIIIKNNNSSKNTGLSILINGEEEKAGKERIIRKLGKRSAEITLDTEILEKKIKAMIDDTGYENSKNMIEIPVLSKDVENIKTVLTGDIVKTMSDKSFDLSITTGDVNYVVPTKEVGIEGVAKQLGISTDNLEDIEINIDISYPAADLTKEIEDNIIKEGYEIVSRPVSFEITAKTKTVTGESKQIAISKFNQFIQRTIEVSENDNDKKISTGVIYDNQGNLLHVPTYIYVEDGVYYARINSLTNSSYTLIWNPKSIGLENNYWAKEAIEEMYSRLVIKKTEGFNPDSYITRGEFVKYVTRALGLYELEINYENIFLDITSSDELFEVASLASEYGLIGGYPDSTFRENRLISKEEAMVVFARAMDLVNLEKNNKTINTHSVEMQEVASWAINDVDKVINADIFKMSESSRFSPKENITYAEIINTLRNLLIKSKLINE
ncbi:MAG: InlB B-repeat-containing protein, partial [Clostridia bacterium]